MAAPAVEPEPSCAGASEGAECWKELSNRAGCHAWDRYHYPDQTVTWSGACVGGIIVGEGTLIWTKAEETGEETGTVSNGRKQGHWVGRWSGGYRFEGDYVDGRQHGWGAETYSNGNRYEGEWRDGMFHGPGTFTWANGDRYEGAWRFNKPHGQGTLTGSNGNRDEGEWRDGCFGERDGNWATIFTSAAECGFE